MKRQSVLAATGNRWAFLGLALLALGSAMPLANAARAQSSYRNSYQQSIAVDDSVLDALGPAPNLIDILNPGRASSALAPHPAIARRLEVRRADLPPPPPGLRSRLTAIPRPSGAVRVTPLTSIPNHVGLNAASAHPPPSPPPPSPPLPVDLDAAYRPPVAGDSPPPVSQPVTKPAAVANSGAVVRSSTLTALAAAETLPLPQKIQLAPPPVSPASPPSAYRPSITAPAPTPEPAPAPALAASPTPLAALASPSPASMAGSKRLLFTSGNAELTLDMQQELDRLATQLQSNDHVRLRVTAYAEGTVETASLARRLSLRRALAVRSYLGDKGIAGARVLVEAQGNQSQGGPADRVDIQVVSGS